MDKKNSVVYSAGFTVRDNSELSSLCLVHDQILLPATGDPPELSAGVDDTPEEVAVNYILMTIFGKAPESFLSWERRHALLFDESVLQRLEPPVGRDSFLDADLEVRLQRSQIRKVFFGMIEDVLEYSRGLGSTSTPMKVLGKLDSEARRHAVYFWETSYLAMHLSRKDLPKDLPSVGVASASDQPTNTQLAGSVIEIVLPSLPDLHPEQILELRRKVADTREGFSLHLQTLTADLEKLVQEGEDLEEIKRHADSIAARQLYPAYREFRRQLFSEKAVAAAKVLGGGGLALNLAATGNWWGALAAFGVTSLLSTVPQLKESLTNKRQAFQFMRKVEEVGE